MIEIIAATLEDAIRIENCGGDRIELVSALSEGGLTPSYGLIKNVVDSVKIPVNVIIRPHSKSFVYTKDEIKIMKEDILMAKMLKANGVVIGALNNKNKICEEALNFLLEACKGMEVTFHRAIDELEDQVEAVKLLAKYPQINNILTSGGKGDIIKNIDTIKRMLSNAGHINILVGGGLNFNNIEKIRMETKAKEYHFGTAVREDKSFNGDIDEERLKQLIGIIK